MNRIDRFSIRTVSVNCVRAESSASRRPRGLRHRLRSPGSDVTSGHVAGSSSLRLGRTSSSATSSPLFAVFVSGWIVKDWSTEHEWLRTGDSRWMLSGAVNGRTDEKEQSPLRLYAGNERRFEKHRKLRRNNSDFSWSHPNTTRYDTNCRFKPSFTTYCSWSRRTALTICWTFLSIFCVIELYGTDC